MSSGAPAVIATIVFTLFLACSAPALAQDDVAVMLRVEKDGEFEVLLSRAGTTVTSAIFFGLIGYGIAEGQRADDDRDREEAILPFISEADCRHGFVESFAAHLTDRNYEVNIAESPKQSAAEVDLLVRIDIHACGFKIVNSSSQQLSAFYAASYAIENPDSKDKQKMSDMLITGTTRGTWEELLADPDLAAAAFDDVRIKAGRRLANRLIYRKEE